VVDVPWNTEMRDFAALKGMMNDAGIFSNEQMTPALENILRGGTYDLTRLAPELERLGVVGAKTTSTQRGVDVTSCGLFCVAAGAMLSAMANPLNRPEAINFRLFREDMARARGQDPKDPNTGIRIMDVDGMLQYFGEKPMEIDIQR